MISRRDLIHAGCAVPFASLLPGIADRAEAASSGSSGQNSNRVTLNAIAVYKNFVKGFGFDQDPTVMNGDSYPQSTPATPLLARSSPNMPAGYYGNFVLKWRGTASLAWIAAPPLVIASGGLSMGFAFDSGDSGPGDLLFKSKTTPRLVFATGWSIQSIVAGASNGSGGNLIRFTVKKTFAKNSAYTNVQVTISGAPLNTGANGTWTLLKVDDSTFDLANTTFTHSGGAQGVALFVATRNSINLPNYGTYSNFSDLVWCRAADEASIDAGSQISDELIAQFQYLGNGCIDLSSRMWLRFMDLTAVQGNWENNFAHRRPVTAMCYGNYYPPAYWVGKISNKGSDNYTCSNPSASGTGAYADGEFIMGKIVGTNTGGVPTLNVNSRGSKPIFWRSTGIWPIQIKFAGPPPSPGTNILQFTFQAPWLTGGTPYVFNYHTQAGDTTVSALVGNLAAAMARDSTLIAAKILLGNNQFSGNGPGVPILPRTAQAGRLTVTYTAGPAILDVIQTIDRNAITDGNLGTFIYNHLLDGFIYFTNPPAFSNPFEILVELSNRTGAHCWFNFGFTTGQFVADTVSFFADPTTGLAQGLKFGWEPWNELWNFAQFPAPLMTTLGIALGFSNQSLDHIYSYAGARVRQQAPFSTTAWTAKGRNPLDHYIHCPTQLGEGKNGNFDRFQMKGASLSSSATIWMTYGGLNGGNGADYTNAGQRPVDFTDSFGCAPYINSHWMGSGSFTNASSVVGSASQNVAWLQAAKDFANGLHTQAFRSLVEQFTRVINRTSGNNGGTDFVDVQGFFLQQETMAAQYDTFRASRGQRKIGIRHYEGGMAFGIGANGNNGVNSVNPGDINALATRMSALDSPAGIFNVSPYTLSGTDNKVEMATMAFNMLQKWKFDPSYKAMIETGYYQALKNTNTGREAHGAQYGYEANNWGLWPVDFRAPSPYSSYDAIHEFNACLG